MVFSGAESETETETEIETEDLQTSLARSCLPSQDRQQSLQSRASTAERSRPSVRASSNVGEQNRCPPAVPMASGSTGTRLLWDDSEDDQRRTEDAQRKKTEARKKTARAAARNRQRKMGTNPPVGKGTAGSTGVGRQGPSKRKKLPNVYSDSNNDEEDLMEWTMPDYLQERKARFDDRIKEMKAAGLHLPPSYDGVYFSDDERLQDVQERPEFPRDLAQRDYQDIPLPHSLGLVPASIAQFLRPYQVDGVAFMHELFVYQKGGILGDDMGLGKTVQVIAFLTAAYGKTGDERDWKRLRKMRKTNRWYPRTLIICPGTLMENWIDEFRRWGWWHVDKYHGPEKHTVLDAAHSGMLEVMITTYHTYRTSKDDINMVPWDCVIADECHTIKETTSQITKSMTELNALCRIGLTGTAIQNKYEELWTLLNWTNPGKLGPLSTWKATICVPLKLGQSHEASVYQLAQARTVAKQLVQNLLPQFFLRRTKALIKHQLPTKTDRVVFCPLTAIQAAAYRNFLESDVVETIKSAGEPCGCGKKKKRGWCCSTTLEDGTPWQHWVFPAIANVQKMINHLAILIPQGSDSAEKQAKDLEMLQIAMPDAWREIYATRESILHMANPEFCGKWKVLKKLLTFWHGSGDNKVLIFSHSVRLLRMLQKLFNSTSFNVSYLDGSMNYEERYQTVRDFNTDPSQFVFLISTRAGGVGLNITSANKVVVVDPNWNPSYDLQAQDRAYRIGQTRDVEVFRLVSQGTLEEIVYARQIYKQQQANIGYTATSERRYFAGVQGEIHQKGEIFGLSNLFSYQEENAVLRDIVNKTNIAESKADLRVANLELDDLESDKSEASPDGDDREVSPPIKAADETEDAAISQLAAEITGDEPMRGKGGLKGQGITKHDPVQAILASVGVNYTHENSEVIGSSKVEALLSKRAEEAAENRSKWGPQEQLSKVFADTQQDEELGGGDDFESAGVYEAAGYAYGTVRYRYHPPEDVRRRQFATMARWAGYEDDVVGFAARVESWTQADRRDCLDRFYAWRRSVLSRHVKMEVKAEKPEKLEIKIEDVGSADPGGEDQKASAEGLPQGIQKTLTGGTELSRRATASDYREAMKKKDEARVVETETTSEDDIDEL